MSGTLALSGCGSGRGEKVGVRADKPPTSTPEATLNPQLSVLVFDDLGGGPSIIQVYPGVTESARDMQSNGTFNDGDKVSADCKLKGRKVQSDISVGEEDRTSDDWIRIHGTPGETQYATMVYVENPDKLLAELPDC